jgi:hypothetical protein
MRKTVGNKTFSIGMGGSSANDPKVYLIQANNQLNPTSFRGIRFIPKAEFPTESQVDLTPNISLIDMDLPAGIGCGIDVTTGEVKLIANTEPAPQVDLVEHCYAQLSSMTMSISAGGDISGGPWTAYIPINIF